MTEDEIRADERRKCWDAINKWIVRGPLPGNGCDASAQRNGMVLATNLIAELGPLSVAPAPP
jgi:hypothetical protein